MFIYHKNDFIILVLVISNYLLNNKKVVFIYKLNQSKINQLIFCLTNVYTLKNLYFFYLTDF